MTVRIACALMTALMLGCTAPGRAAAGPGSAVSAGEIEPPPAIEPSLPGTASETVLAAGQTSFGSRLLAELLADSPDENLLVSPLSVSLALAMAAAGARGPTRTALYEAIGLSGFEPAAASRAHSALLDRLDTEDSDLTLDLANALWVRRGIPLSDEYVETCAEHYRARAAELDFRSEQAVEVINGWVQERTRDRITGVVDRLREEDLLLLVNAVYFKGRWSVPFEKELTRDRDFLKPDRSRVTVPMMHRTGEFDYAEEDRLQVLRLPYGEGEYALYLLLPAPDDPDGIAGLVARLTPDELSRRVAGLRAREGELVLPRFRLEYAARLNEVLGRLGLDAAFDPARADFMAMLKAEVDMAFFISEVVHKCFVEVGEAGTEAAAVTGVRMGITSVAPEPDRFRMVCDRPFLWLIRHAATGTVLFIGVVNDPS